MLCLNRMVTIIVSSKLCFIPNYIYTLFRWFNSRPVDNCNGCRFGVKYVGVCGFLVDMKLVSPNLLGRQNICCICKAISTSSGLTFNAKKTRCIKFHYGHHVNEITQHTIYLGNHKLQWYSQGSRKMSVHWFQLHSWALRTLFVSLDYL